MGFCRNLFTALYVLAVFAANSVDARADEYEERLTRRAEELKLHENRDWQILLHYTKRLTGGLRSTVDDAKFFLTAEGRTDSRAELAATVKSLFVSGAGDGEYVACRFPARYEWLVEKLGIDVASLPTYGCSERDAELQAVEIKAATLVFPVGHINSPASMFGHTLIQIDGTSRSNLLSHAVNYAAQTSDTNGFVYAWKGLTGRYRGLYSLMPYYRKVLEYSDLEHRDMWEYQLDLSETEVRRMLNHIWELNGIGSPYYFIDENCSYNLLFLLEAARPNLHLTDQAGLMVLPTNTIQWVIQSGLVKNVIYRPSQGTKLKSLMSELDPDSLKKAYRIASDQNAPSSIEPGTAPANKAKILELAAGYLQYRYARKEIEKASYTKLYLSILDERSRLGSPVDASSRTIEPKPPEAGHDTAKITIGGGTRRGRPFVEIGVRPQFQGLLDPDDGYLPGAQIQFLDTAIRYDLHNDDLRLKRLHLIDIISVSPRDMFFRSVSWKVNAGLDRELTGSGRDHTLYRLNTGGGVSLASPSGGIFYGLAELDGNAGRGIRAGAALGAGASVGWLEEPLEWWKFHLALQGMWYRLGDDRRSLKATLGQNIRMNRNNSVEINVQAERVNDHGILDMSLLWKHFF